MDDLLTAALAAAGGGWPVFMLGRSKRPVANCDDCRNNPQIPGPSTSRPCRSAQPARPGWSGRASCLEAWARQHAQLPVPGSGKGKQYLMQIGADEASHVATITATIQKLGGTPVGASAVDFGGAFESRKSYLTTAHIFENKGVGAYLGAAGFVKDKIILQAAAGIFGVEARHAAWSATCSV